MPPVFSVFTPLQAARAHCAGTLTGRMWRGGLLWLALSGGAALRAQETAAVTLETVAVTARRGAQELGKVPGAVTAYAGDFLAANGITDYEALSRIVPGLFVTGQSVDNVSFNLRGLTSDTGDPRMQPRVSIFQDGVMLHNVHGNGVALFDTERVAVFKGPQPTRFGRGVQSGALALASNRAVNADSVALAVGGGDYAARSGSLTVNRAVVADKVFARVAVYSNARDGYVRNLADGSDLQGEDTLALRTSLRWQPAAATTVDLIFNYQRDDTPGAALKSMTGIPGLPAVADVNPFTPTNLNRGSALEVSRTLLGLTAIIRQKLGDAWTLAATSGWRDIDSAHEFDADGSLHFLLEAGESFRGWQLSQEVRFDYDRGGRLTASAGVGVSQSADEQTAIVRTDENVLWRFVTRTPPPVVFNRNYTEGFANEADVASADIFGRAEYQIEKRLVAGGELRLTRERLASRYESFAAPVPGRLVGAAPTSGGVNNFFRNTPGRLEHTLDAGSWSGQLDARYTLTPQVAAYAAVSRGRHAPVLDFNALTLAPQTHAEETVWNYEAGVKGASAGGRVRYEASVFHYRFEHFQSRRVVTLGVIAPYDGGRARGQGVEGAVHATLAPGLTAFATYGFTDAEFSATDAEGAPQLFAGNRFRLTSRHVVSLGGTATWAAGRRGAIFLTPLVTYRSEYFFEDDNAQNGGLLRQGGYALVNLRVGYRARSGAWEITGYANNLLDKKYLLDAGNIGGGYGIPTSVAAAPRLTGVQAAVRF